MKIIKFDINNSKPHPNFKGVYLSPILDETENLGVRSNYALISPNCEISPHTHDVVEVFTIIRGNPSVLINEEWVKIETGITVVASPGEIHGVRNNSDEDVILEANFKV